MLIVTENKGSLKKEASSWVSGSKDALVLAIRKYQNRRTNIFLVGPDHYWIEDGRFVGKNQGIYYWIDRNGFIGGFDIRTISDRIETVDDSLWSFRMGRQKVQLIFN
jgi:hypothetical protein